MPSAAIARLLGRDLSRRLNAPSSPSVASGFGRGYHSSWTTNQKEEQLFSPLKLSLWRSRAPSGLWGSGEPRVGDGATSLVPAAAEQPHAFPMALFPSYQCLYVTATSTQDWGSLVLTWAGAASISHKGHTQHWLTVPGFSPKPPEPGLGYLWVVPRDPPELPWEDWISAFTCLKAWLVVGISLQSTYPSFSFGGV